VEGVEMEGVDTADESDNEGEERVGTEMIMD